MFLGFPRPLGSLASPHTEQRHKVPRSQSHFASGRPRDCSVAALGRPGAPPPPPGQVPPPPWEAPSLRARRSRGSGLCRGDVGSRLLRVVGGGGGRESGRPRAAGQRALGGSTVLPGHGRVGGGQWQAGSSGVVRRSVPWPDSCQNKVTLWVETEESYSAPWRR